LNPANPKTNLLLLLTLVSLATAGVSCGKKQPPVQQGASPTVVPATIPPASTTPPAPVYSPSPGAVAANPDGGANLKQLNHAFMKWIAINHRRPGSFAEFTAACGLQIPPPPAGKKYVIDQNGFINVAVQ
jgi:hypothetical protein